MSDILKNRLVAEEGLRLLPYLDTEGIWTIGVGHNMQVDPNFSDAVSDLRSRGTVAIPDHAITEEQAYALLDYDIQKATNALYDKLPWTLDLNEARREVLVDMTFNEGIGNSSHGLLSFIHTLDDLKNGRWQSAVNRLRQSAWYAEVKPIRAEPLLKIILTGEVQNV